MKTLFTEYETRTLREATMSIEAVLRAAYDTGINSRVGYAFTKDIAERTGVPVKTINSWLGKAERKGLIKGYSMTTRRTGGRRPSGTPVRMKHWHLTPEGRKMLGIKSVLDDGIERGPEGKLAEAAKGARYFRTRSQRTGNDYYEWIPGKGLFVHFKVAGSDMKTKSDMKLRDLLGGEEGDVIEHPSSKPNPTARIRKGSTPHHYIAKD